MTVDKVDYFGRMGILCISVWLGFYVNKIYMQRLRKSAYRLMLQRFISEVSSDFINVTQSNLERKVHWIMRIVGKLFQLDEIHVLQFDLEQSAVQYRLIWSKDKRQEQTEISHPIDAPDIAWLSSQFVHDELVHIPDVDLMPDIAENAKKVLQTRQVHSIVATPIIEHGAMLKILEFSSKNAKKKWETEEFRVLKIISNIFADALTRVEAEEEITHMAYHDQLTGLPNRRLFQDNLQQAISAAKQTGKSVGVVFIDLDSFKAINDTLGHKGGDMLLKMVADKLLHAVRDSDVVSRFGGDEFLIMLNPIASAEDNIPIVENLMSVLAQPVVVEGQAFYPTLSAGVATYPADGQDTDSLIKHADMAMYKAKELGKNQYVICSNALKEAALTKIKITNSLYHALEREEFVLHYQPQVELRTGEIIGLEALIRWNNPELGFVSPANFIPIAEQIGLISDIGEWVLKTACMQNQKWQNAGYAPVCIAVNVSANQLQNPDFVRQVQNVLRETALPTQYLELEITESAAMTETTDIVQLLIDIRNLGIMVSIDDFGTDYSSLCRLKVLPIDKLKIDKQFIDSVAESEKDQAIVRTIINLSQNLGLKVIAEGVESQNQLEFLKQEACDEVQGYYYYKPMPATEIEAIFAKHDAGI